MVNSYHTLISNGTCNIFSRYVDDIFVIILVLICKKKQEMYCFTIHTYKYYKYYIYNIYYIYICEIQHVSFFRPHMSVSDNRAIV